MSAICLYVKLWLARVSPGLLRWVFRRNDLDLMAAAVGNIEMDEKGQLRLTAGAVAAMPGNRVVIPAYYVATTMQFWGGGMTVGSLSELFYLKESAEHKRRELVARFPSCSVHGTVLIFDPANAKQLAQLGACNRQMVLESLQPR